MRFIKKVTGVFCAIMTITCIILAFTESKGIIFEAFIFGILAFLLLRKPKQQKDKLVPSTQNDLSLPETSINKVQQKNITNTQNAESIKNFEVTQKQLNNSIEELNKMISSGNVFKVTVQKASAPKETLTSMRTSYSTVQMQNDLRILTDSVNILKSTNNLETFFSRYDLAMQNSLTLEQAKEAGLLIDNPFPPDYIMELKNRLDCILQDNYEKELKRINDLKTQSGKRNRIDKFISKISEYEDEFEFSDLYKSIIDNMNLLKKEGL